MPLVVLSPHLDDGVLSCGALLSSHPGSVVATTHAGRPRDDLPGQWDIACGFGTASEAMDARLAEDKRALAVLGATAAYCPALDSQYPSSATIRRLAQRNFIERVLDSYEAERLLLPLGLLHGDHIESRNAALAVLRSHGERGDMVLLHRLALRPPVSGVNRKCAIRDGAARIRRGTTPKRSDLGS